LGGKQAQANTQLNTYPKNMSEYKLDYFQYMPILLLNTKASASLILHKRLLYNIAVCVCICG